MSKENISAALGSEGAEKPRRPSPEPAKRLDATTPFPFIPANFEFGSIRNINQETPVQGSPERTQSSGRCVILDDSGDVSGKFGSIRRDSACADTEQLESAFATPNMEEPLESAFATPNMEARALQNEDRGEDAENSKFVTPPVNIRNPDDIPMPPSPPPKGYGNLDFQVFHRRKFLAATGRRELYAQWGELMPGSDK